MEAAGLGVFMLSACVCATLLQHPASPVAQVIQPPLLQRFLMGLAMALTAISIVYSPWGKQSGAHLNPAVTLTFFRLGKVAPWDALWYVIAQFVGGILGVGLAATLLWRFIADPTVNYVVTVPGRFGAGVAFVAEVLIAFILMSVVLRVSNNRPLNRFTGLCAGLLVAMYITLEAPLSGMSLNPARTFGSALSAQVWTALWIYFLAPPWACSWRRNCMCVGTAHTGCSARNCTITTPGAVFFIVAMRMHCQRTLPDILGFQKQLASCPAWNDEVLWTVQSRTLARQTLDHRRRKGLLRRYRTPYLTASLER